MIPSTTRKRSELLENLLVEAPELLANKLKLVGRQLPTSGGYLDLLGVDEDGRLVVFELKRGVLTRDAVAQVIDYASELAERDLDGIARLIEENSGRQGIEEFEDFLDWYDREYGSDRDTLERAPRMVLVGLGVDDRARRMVAYLAESSVPIELLTFHAFKRNGDLLLAREVEISTTGTRSPTSPTKESNRRILHATAESLHVRDLLDVVAGFVQTRVPGYQWPGKTSYTFSLHEKTSEGRPSLRAYVTVYVNFSEPGSLLFQLSQRAVEAAGDATARFCSEVPGAHTNKSSSVGLELKLRSDGWAEIQTPLDRLLRSMMEGYRRKFDDSAE